MSQFERTYQIDPSREKDYQREYSSIELSDEEYLAKLKQYRPYDSALVYKPENIVKEEDLHPIRLVEDEKGLRYEKVPSEKPKRKPKKVPTRSDQAAVARVQKKL